jgi:hypothetical protein
MNITPETDAMVESSFYSINFPTNPIPAEFARRLERERDELLALLASEKSTRNHIVQKFGALAYWRDISECDCNDPIPNGGCLRCDLDKVFNTTNQND